MGPILQQSQINRGVKKVMIGLIRDRKERKIEKGGVVIEDVKILRILLALLCSIILFSSIAFAHELHVSSSRYSLFAPYVSKASDASLSANFTGFALLLDDSGKPVSGANIIFKIYSGSGVLKATKYNITGPNGLASVPYDTYPDFTSSSDTDYGTWRIEANLTGNLTVNHHTNMQIEAGGKALGGCGQDNCHKTSTVTGAKPLSPYTDRYGQTSTRAASAHKKSNHQNAGCPSCHTGYASDKTATGTDGKVYGKTADVHRNRTCEFCHGNWAYIRGTGNGIPKMPSCSQCHPVLNNNVMTINTLANLTAGNNISVYSYNYDVKSPLTAHNGTMYSLVDSVPCIVCHGPAHNNSKPYNEASSSNGVTENEQCWTCHTSRTNTHKLNTNCISCHTQDAHAISIAGGGGRDCISCHDIGKSLEKVDVSKINSSDSIHASLNSGGTTSLRADNRICWGCHTNDSVSSDGIVNEAELPADAHPFGYNTPKNCGSCHIQENFGALIIDAHFSNSSNIRTKSYENVIDSCVNCHNKTEMILANSDPGSPKSIYASVSHYGDNKSQDAPYNSGSSANCTYCHQGDSAFSSEMNNATWNSSIQNHTAMAGNPNCTNTNCHNTGRIHYSTIAKPEVNTSLCKTCHTGKDRHNNSVDCAGCHLSSEKNIHPVQYLQKNATWSTSPGSNSVNCTDCHQGSGMNGFSSPKIPDDLKHSSNVLNGTIWGSYWTSEGSACIYCHNDTRHNTAGLGKVAALMDNPANTKSGALSNTEWCAGCHYNASAYYGGAQWSPVPPILLPAYHGSVSEYKDSNCQSCHSINGTLQETPKNYTHSLDPGVQGGPDCKSCHDAGSTLAPKLVNFSAMNSSAAGHKDLNSGASANVNAENKKCWACHGEGIQPTGHPAAYKTPLDCQNCHTGAGYYSAPVVPEHQQTGQDVITPVNCTQCHDNNGMYIGGTGVGTVNHYIKEVTDMTTTPYGHSGPIDTSTCILCHNGLYTNDPEWGAPVNISTLTGRPHAETLTSECDTCHKDASISTLANVDFHNAAIKPGAGGANCLQCHAGNE